jgi:hypothetical protein
MTHNIQFQVIWNNLLNIDEHQIQQQNETRKNSFDSTFGVRETVILMLYYVLKYSIHFNLPL